MQTFEQLACNYINVRLHMMCGCHVARKFNGVVLSIDSYFEYRWDSIP